MKGIEEVVELVQKWSEESTVLIDHEKNEVDFEEINAAEGYIDDAFWYERFHSILNLHKKHESIYYDVTAVLELHFEDESRYFTIFCDCSTRELVFEKDYLEIEFKYNDEEFIMHVTEYYSEYEVIRIIYFKKVEVENDDDEDDEEDYDEDEDW